MHPDFDWTQTTRNAFVSRVTEQLEFYVYLLIDPRNNQVFYVGKGTGNRCFEHLVEARKTNGDTAGEYAKLARIREIEASGSAVRIELLRHGLSENEAFHVEAAAIDLLPHLDNRVAGHDHKLGRKTVAEVNAQFGAEPIAIHPHHRVVLITINREFKPGMSDEALYEATRKWWVVGPGRRQLGTSSAPQWAMAVYRGVVRAVYRIEAWEPSSDEDITQDPKRAGRWKFRGRRDPSMEERYLYGDVSRYASQNPLRYVNCPAL